MRGGDAARKRGGRISYREPSASRRVPDSFFSPKELRINKTLRALSRGQFSIPAFFAAHQLMQKCDPSVRLQTLLVIVW
jgi:hypothetical protein